MRRRSCGLILVLLFAGVSAFFYVHETECMEAPPIEWTQTYGGENEDYGHCVIQTSDGGYAIAGETNSFGSWDSYLIKTYPNGTIEWEETYGSLQDREGAHSIVQTSDGGYTLAGYCHYQFIPPLYNNYDFYLVKADSTGNSEWSETPGNWWPSDEKAHCVIEISGEAYMMVGEDDYDVWLYKARGGSPAVSRRYGGVGSDIAYSLIEIKDGYLIAGYTTSYGAGNQDFWLIRTDTAGDPMWNRTYGGDGSDIAYSVVATNDGGFAVAGYTGPSGGPYDFLLVKTDSYGNPEWNQTFGGMGSETARSVVQTIDGGYAVAGSTDLYGSWDFWLVKTDADGNMQWNKTIGGGDYEAAYSMVQTSDGGYALTGFTWSESAGTADVMLTKVAPDIHDVAITAVTPHKTVVGEGYTMNINITAENQGTMTETFDISVLAGGFLIDTIDDVTLAGGDTTTLTFPWDTTGWQKNRYKISASATPVPSEMETADNNYNDGTVTITIPGDIDGDYYVGSADAGILNGAYGSWRGDPLYVPEADFDCDGYIGSVEAGILNGNYGLTAS